MIRSRGREKRCWRNCPQNRWRRVRFVERIIAELPIDLQIVPDAKLELRLAAEPVGCAKAISQFHYVGCKTILLAEEA